MTDPKHVALAALLTGTVLVACGPAQAFTARQYTAGGEGTYATSSGMPANFVGGASTAQPGQDGARGANQPRDLEHHGRYFGGE